MSSSAPDDDRLAALERARLVPVVVLDDAADAGPLADALVAGGLPVAEVTFRTPAAADAIRAMADRGGLLLGAGTVLTPAQVDEAVAAGAGPPAAVPGSVADGSGIALPSCRSGRPEQGPGAQPVLDGPV